MSDAPKSFTLVFEGNIRQFKVNPLTTETPFGTAIIASVGNAMEELNAYRGIVERVAEHFEHTTAPLGKAAREAIDTNWALK